MENLKHRFLFFPNSVENGMFTKPIFSYPKITTISQFLL